MSEPIGREIIKGVKGIAAEIGEDERATYYQLSKGLVPGAYKVGRQWRAHRGVLSEAIIAKASVGLPKEDR